jgi:hypothetical protein
MKISSCRNSSFFTTSFIYIRHARIHSTASNSYLIVLLQWRKYPTNKILFISHMEHVVSTQHLNSKELRPGRHAKIMRISFIHFRLLWLIPRVSETSLPTDSTEHYTVYRKLWSATVQRRFWNKAHCTNSIKQLRNQKYTHTYVLKLNLLHDLQQKVGELVLSITSCPTIIILENALN